MLRESFKFIDGLICGWCCWGVGGHCEGIGIRGPVAIDGGKLFGM